MHNTVKTSFLLELMMEVASDPSHFLIISVKSCTCPVLIRQDVWIRNFTCIFICHTICVNYITVDQELPGGLDRRGQREGRKKLNRQVMGHQDNICLWAHNFKKGSNTCLSSEGFGLSPLSQSGDAYIQWTAGWTS